LTWPLQFSGQSLLHLRRQHVAHNFHVALRAAPAALLQRGTQLADVAPGGACNDAG